MRKLPIIALTAILAVSCAKHKPSTSATTVFQASLTKAIENQKAISEKYSDSASFCKAEKLLYYSEQMEINTAELNKLNNLKNQLR